MIWMEFQKMIINRGMNFFVQRVTMGFNGGKIPLKTYNILMDSQRILKIFL